MGLKIKNILKTLLGSPVGILVFLFSFFNLLSRLRQFEFIVYAHGVGFGHTVTGPDCIRRTHAGKKTALVFFSIFERHNFGISKIWQDIDVIFIPMYIEFRFLPDRLRRWIAALPVADRNRNWMSRLFTFLLQGPGREVKWLNEYYAEIPRSSELDRTIKNLPASKQWPICYFHLMQDVSVPHPALPRELTSQIKSRLNAGRDISLTGLCGLYLRQKDVGGVDVASRMRNGSEPDAYIDSIRLLIQEGYQVLLCGDVETPSHWRNEFGGNLADAKSLGITKSNADLYAATAVDIYIGDVGGGTWLPGIADIPRLVLNAYPYFYGFPKTWISYKKLVDSTGRVKDFREVFREDPYALKVPGFNAIADEPNEITSNVRNFISEVRLGWKGPTVIEKSLPETTWLWQSGGRISPAFLARYPVEEKRP